MAKDLHTFEGLFRELFKPLCAFAMKYVHDLDMAKEIVHDVFVIIWEKFESLPADTNYRSYLFTSVRNRCLNHLRDTRKVVLMETVPEQSKTEGNQSLEAAELEQAIAFAIESLPDRCRMVFELNRNEGLKYAEIADKMMISVKTVEAQMSKALALLRNHLKEFLTLLFFMMGT